MLPKSEVAYVQAQLTPERRERIRNLLQRIGRLRPEKGLAQEPMDIVNANLIFGHLHYLVAMAEHHLSQFPAGILCSITKNSLQKINHMLRGIRTDYAIYDPEDDCSDDEGSKGNGDEVVYHLPTTCIGEQTLGRVVDFYCELEEMIQWFKHPKRHYARRCELVSMTPVSRESDVELPY